MLDILKSLFDNPLFKVHVKYFTKTYHANERILQQNKMHKDVYLIKKGKVKIVIEGHITAQSMPNEALHPSVKSLGTDEIFGEFALFDDAPANADVVAETECELIEIDISSFREFLNTHPEIGYPVLCELLKILVERLRHADKAIINLYTWGIKVHNIDKYLE